jgi:hypothetical protein
VAVEFRKIDRNEAPPIRTPLRLRPIQCCFNDSRIEPIIRKVAEKLYQGLAYVIVAPNAPSINIEIRRVALVPFTDVGRLSKFKAVI